MYDTPGKGGGVAAVVGTTTGTVAVTQLPVTGSSLVNELAIEGHAGGAAYSIMPSCFFYFNRHSL